jgi:RHS repeat-associated protein
MILSQAKGGVVSHFVPDPLGSVVMVRDTSGNTVYEAEYDPYGNVQSETGTNPSSLGYVGTLGYVKDSATSMYVRARYLLSNLGRWLTKDPLWPDEAGFVYSDAIPTVLSDPTGLTVRWCKKYKWKCIQNCSPRPYISCFETKAFGRWTMTTCTCGKRINIGRIIKGLPIVAAGANAICIGFFVDCVRSIFQGDLKEAMCTCWQAFNDAADESNRITRFCFSIACGETMDAVDLLFGCGDAKPESPGVKAGR